MAAVLEFAGFFDLLPAVGLRLLVEARFTDWLTGFTVLHTVLPEGKVARFNDLIFLIEEEPALELALRALLFAAAGVPGKVVLDVGVAVLAGSRERLSHFKFKL
jgi:hypothetical protein